MFPVIYDGTGKAQPERVALRAGVLNLVYEAGMLRCIRVGDQEIMRGIYAAVRDQNWGTVPAALRDVEMDVRDDSFRITFTSDHQQGDIHFVWRGEIVGTAESTIRFSFDGEALTTFRRNRVGFCVLHPMDVAGLACDIEHVNGETEHGAFPKAIAPHQPYFDIRAITHEALPGVRAQVRMEGDSFELEDQRNWIDASYKTYCTPLALPFPATLEAGTRVQQAVTVRLTGDIPSAQEQTEIATLTVDQTSTMPLPSLGLGVASHGEPLTPREIERLKALNVARLRVDVRFTDDVEAQLRQAWSEAQALGAHLEVAVHFGEDYRGELLQLRSLVETIQIAGTLLLFRTGQPTTPRELVDAAREAFNGCDALLIGGGTDAFFTQLNRNRPPADVLDVITYSVNPQVHAFDNASLVETIPAVAATVESARQFAQDKPIAVTPITFKMRWNPDATAPERETPPGVLPRRVDPRQMSLFGAGWTLGTIAALAQAGAERLTYFETTGWLGVMERESGSPLPELFPSIAGGVYPMYHVFADMGEFADGEAVSVTISDPLAFSGLALRQGDAFRVLIANHTHERQQVRVQGIDGNFIVKSLDETTAEAAMREPKRYRMEANQPMTAGENGLTMELLPYAVVRLDQVG